MPTNCQECKNRLYPEDPSVPFFNPKTRRYLPPLCESCNNPNKEPIIQEIETVKKQERELLQLRSDVAFLRKKIAEMANQKPKTNKLKEIQL